MMSSPDSVPIWRLQLLFSAAGALALGIQTSLLREFIVLLQGDEMAVGLGLAAWFVGIAVGARAARRGANGAARSVVTVSLTMLGLLGCVGVVGARLLRGVTGLSTFEPLALTPALLVAVGLFVVPGFCVGAAFVALATVATAALGNAQAAIGRLYVFEAIGSLVAGLVISFGLSIYLTPLHGIGILVGASLLGAMPAARARAIAGTRNLWIASGLSLLLGVTPAGSWLERTTEKARFAAMALGSPLLAFEHTPYQHIAIGGNGQRVLYANGQYVTSFPDPTANELLAHQLMLLSRQPKRMLSFGGLETGLLRHCLRHSVARLDIVLLDPAAFHLLVPHLDAADRAALSDPRVHIVFEDPRRFLSRPGEPYDLVVSLEPDPNTLFLARTTSFEFHRLVRSRLATDGAYVTRFSAAPNVQSGSVGLLGATLYSTLNSAFSVVHATAGNEAFLVAGTSWANVTIDTKILEQRYRERAITSEAFLPELLPELVPHERGVALNGELAVRAQTIEPAHDDRPIAFLHAQSVRQTISGSAWASLLSLTARHPGWLVTLLLAPSTLLFLWQRLGSRPAGLRVAALHATAVTGACGLVANLILFVSFQTRVGALYSDLGALSGLFMLGLAYGGLKSTRYDGAHPLRRAQKTGWLLTAILVLSLGAIEYLPAGGAWVWLVHVALLLSIGVTTGLVFPAASRECLTLLNGDDVGNARVVASRLELWDHAGAAVAALLAAVLLIPTFGLLRSAGLLLILQTVALATTWFAGGRALAR